MSMRTTSSPASETSKTGANRGARMASAALGGTLLTLGLKRRSLGGTALALVGGWLFYRGVGGRGRPLRALGTSATDRDRPEVGAPADATEVERSITVGRPADELFDLWRDPERLARVMGHFAEVSSSGEDAQHWTLRGSLGRNVAWDSRIVEERPGEFLRWESVEGAAIPNEGSVRFRSAPDDRGTEVTLRFRFDPPGGALGDAAMKRLGVVPDTITRKALRRFKSLAETGEIPTLERNPSARGSGDRV
ncbi:SRPBCC family protein [Haladaptatus salinisoli]|uniref:SRPBCC family protein n=1 Tax=Haladaptatus salinisoli TaxID=2884876 RepID=UPI001D0ACCF1|nr:SRPBCC family protein [Haladaptatus salinisoli]